MVKSLILFCLSFVFSTIGIGQNSLIRKTAPANIIVKSSPISYEENVYESNWDTTKFNPYPKGTVLEFPFELDFSNEYFNMPIFGPTTSHYGSRRGRAHKGIDLDLETGDVVKSVMDGKVRFARYYSGFGNVIVVRHNNGLETIYAHLSEILVKPEDYVFSGTPIGLGGNTGKSTGSHLHFEARYKNHSINPEYLFDLEGTQNLQDNGKLLVTKFWTQPSKHRSSKKSNIVLQRPVFHVEKEQPKEYNSLVIHANNSSLVKSNAVTQEFSVPKTTQQNFEVRSHPKPHIIAAGENFRSIAHSYKTSIEKLCQLNGLTRTSHIKVGQIIYIPQNLN